MGRQKLLLPIGGKPILSWVLDSLRQGGVDEVVVVLGEDAAAIRKAVKLDDVRVVVNRSPAKGLSGSLRLGLGAVEGKAEAAMVALGDQPFLSPATVRLLVETYRKGAKIAVPVYGGKRGNPVLFEKRFFREIMMVSGDVGAKSVVRDHGPEVSEVEVKDSGVSFDVDTPPDYERATSKPGPTEGSRTREGA